MTNSRQFLYRGKAINRDPEGSYRSEYKNGDWVYGLLSKYEPDFNIAEMTNERGITRIDVDYKTIGKVTIIDGIRFGEGDLVEVSANLTGDQKEYGVIRFGEFLTGYNQDPFTGFYIEWQGKYCQEWRKSIKWWLTERDLRIVGNIYDNPDGVTLMPQTTRRSRIDEVVSKVLDDIKADIRDLYDADNECYTAGLKDAIYHIDLKLKEGNFNV